jgi:hypothetical protein
MRVHLVRGRGDMCVRFVLGGGRGGAGLVAKSHPGGGTPCCPAPPRAPPLAPICGSWSAITRPPRRTQPLQGGPVPAAPRRACGPLQGGPVPSRQLHGQVPERRRRLRPAPRQPSPRSPPPQRPAGLSALAPDAPRSVDFGGLPLGHVTLPRPAVTLPADPPSQPPRIAHGAPPRPRASPRGALRRSAARAPTAPRRAGSPHPRARAPSRSAGGRRSGPLRFAPRANRGETCGRGASGEGETCAEILGGAACVEEAGPTIASSHSKTTNH